MPPTSEPAAISPAAVQFTVEVKRKNSAATLLTIIARAFFTPLIRCRSSWSSMPIMASSRTPCAAPK